MNVTKSSAMTEASGLASDEARIEHAFEAIRGMTREMVNELPTQRRSLSETLHKAMIEAPLQSLVIAFLLGVLVARDVDRV